MDKDKAIQAIKEKAKALKQRQIARGEVNKFGEALCARYVRQSLEAGGIIVYPPNDGGHGYAKNFGGPLLDAGFEVVADVQSPSIYPLINYKPIVSDILVMDTYPGQRVPAGHMAMFTGYKPNGKEEWYSDFDQPRGFWAGGAYEKYRPKYKIYRYTK